MDDLISRQAAIDAIGKKSDEIYKTKQKGATHPHDDFFQGMAYAESVVKELPSAQPERKKGKWIIKDNPGTGWYRVTCSECGEDVASIAPCIGFYPNAKVTWDYCPNCGADMREVDDERPD